MVSNRAGQLSVRLPSTGYDLISICGRRFRVWAGPVEGDHAVRGIRILPAREGEFLFAESECDDPRVDEAVYLVSGPSLEEAISRLRRDWLHCEAPLQAGDAMATITAHHMGGIEVAGDPGYFMTPRYFTSAIYIAAEFARAAGVARVHFYSREDLGRDMLVVLESGCESCNARIEDVVRTIADHLRKLKIARAELRYAEQKGPENEKII